MNKYILLGLLITIFMSCGEGKKETAVEITPLDAAFDPLLAFKGEELFKKKCYSCHREDKKLIGPAMKGVTERREAEWIIRMIKEPEIMVKEDSIAIALLKEYKGSPMSNMHLSDYETRAVFEYLRKLK